MISQTNADQFHDLSKDDMRRFWRRIETGPGPGCWPFISEQQGNYPRFGWQSAGRAKTDAVHRIAFFLANGSIPRGNCSASQVVRHTCDRPNCCNPKHLVLGSQKQNVRDAIERNRNSPPPRFSGASHPRAKLTESDVVEVRRLLVEGLSLAEVARRFSAGESTIRHLRDGDTWRCVQ